MTEAVPEPADGAARGSVPGTARGEAPGPPLRLRVRRALSSIRLRLLLSIGGLLALALLASVLAVRAVLLERLDRRVNAELIQEVEELRALAAGRDPETGEPFGARVDRIIEVFLRRNVPPPYETMLGFVDGQPYLRSARPPPARLDQEAALVQRLSGVEAPLRGSYPTAAGPVEYLAVPLRAGGEARGVFAVGIFRDYLRAEVEEVVGVAGLVGAGALGLGLVAALALSGRILVPIRALTRTATAIEEHDLSQRIELGGNDELAQLAATFNSMLDRLERAFGAQREFFDDAGHELRTPITIIRGHLEVMGDSPQERAEVVALVLDELDRMHRMVEDLLLLAKAQRQDFLRLGPVDVASLTHAVYEKAQALRPSDWRLEAVADGVVQGDGQRLTQALVQLAGNAAAYSPPGTALALGSERRDGTVRLWVRDDGPGIPLEEQPKIFDRFWRGALGQRAREGSGLGLAIVRAIAEAHGGHVLLDSAPGAGTRFTLVLPSHPAGQQAGHPADAPAT